MIYIIIPIIIIFIIFLIGLSYYNQSNTVDNIKIKLEETSKNISISQEKEIETLTKINKLIQKEYNKKALTNLSKIKNKSLNIFELDEELWSLNKTLKNFIEDNKINTYDEMNELHSILIELNGLKLFFNKYAEEYNSLISKFKYILFKILKKEQKMTQFKIHKEIEFEILKTEKKQ